MSRISSGSNLSRCRWAFLVLACALSPAALAAPFDFVPAPQVDLNRVYRIDRFSGEVAACQYGLQEGNVGVTLCYAPGEGAGAQAPGEYALVASRHEREGGVFRVNHRTGDVSVCYVFDDRVVCTPQTGPASAGASPPSPAGGSAAPSRPSATPARP